MKTLLIITSLLLLLVSLKESDKVFERNKHEQVFDKLLDKELNTVNIEMVEAYSNPLVNYAGYGAWTQSSTKIFCSNNEEVLRILPYVLHHEANHIRQFKENANSTPSSFTEMLDYEIDTYTNTLEWVQSNEGRNKYASLNELFRDNFDLEHSIEAGESVLDLVMQTRQMAMSAIAVRDFDGTFSKKHNALLLKCTSKGKLITDNLLVQIAMIENELLPPFNMGRSTPILIKHVYTPNDMYLEGENSQDKDRFAILGY